MKPIVRLGRQSIARRLLLAVLAAGILLWLAIYIEGLILAQYKGSGNFDRDMATVAGALRDVMERHPDAPSQRLALDGLGSKMLADERELELPPGYMAFNVWRQDGTRLATLGAAAGQRLARAGQLGYFDAAQGGQHYRVLAQATADGRHVIEVMQHQGSRRAFFDGMMFSSAGLLMPLMIGVPLLLLPVWAAMHTGLRPLRQLAQQLATRQPGDLAPLNLPQAPSELAPMVEQFNGTLRQLRNLLQRERNFLADAAHEIRTPLAVISAQGEALLEARDEAERRAAGERLRLGVHRSTRLVNQLLSLARLDADVEDEWVEIDLADFIRDHLAEQAACAVPRGVELVYLGPDSLRLPCLEGALHAALGNLVGNALRYGHEGGRVEVSVEKEASGTVRLSVRDDGPGIPLPERLQVFERFRRGRNPTATGSGLGLAIVASAARQLGARIDVTDGLAGRGVSITLVWPAPFPPQLRLAAGEPATTWAARRAQGT